MQVGTHQPSSGVYYSRVAADGVHEALLDVADEERCMGGPFLGCD